MKISIEKECSVQDAINLLQSFIDNNKLKQSILKTNMNVYINIDVDSNDLKEEYYLKKDDIPQCNAEVNLRTEAKYQLEQYVKMRSKEVYSIQDEKDRAEKNYRKAREKDWATTEDWKIKYKYLSDEYKKLKKYITELENIKKCIKEDKYNVYSRLNTKEKYKKATYEYYIAIDETCEIMEKTLYLYYSGLKIYKNDNNLWFFC